MGRQRSEAEAQQEIADVEKKKADEAAAEARKLEEQAAGDLAIATPALEAVDPARFGAVVTTAFTKRRKTLRNALSGLIDVTTLEALGIDAQLRPENLSVADYVAITHAANPITARE